jgi:hypothetical protein
MKNKTTQNNTKKKRKERISGGLLPGLECGDSACAFFTCLPARLDSL